MSEFFKFLSHVAVHTLEDTLTLLPFLFVTYLIMETLEHRASDRVNGFITKSGRYGPLTGAVLGLLPQCGFSAAMAGLFRVGVIGGGTLLAVFLSTSDEMLPILISKGLPISEIGTILALKFGIACISGFIFAALVKDERKESIEHLCHEEGCRCDKGILLSAIHHTLSVWCFVFLTVLVFELGMELLGDRLFQALTKIPFITKLLSSLFGLIPGCASSVIITELYADGAVTLGTLMSCLLTGSGVGILVLFRTNKNIKENLKIVFALLLVGITCGVLTDALL